MREQFVLEAQITKSDEILTLGSEMQSPCYDIAEFTQTDRSLRPECED